MSMSWNEVIRTLKAQGFCYYNSASGPLELAYWTGPTKGTNDYWFFVNKNTVRRDPKHGYAASDDEYTFS